MGVIDNIHTQRACELFNVKPEEVSKQQYNDAKNFNFRLIYGSEPALMMKSPPFKLVAGARHDIQQLRYKLLSHFGRRGRKHMK